MKDRMAELSPAKRALLERMMKRRAEAAALAEGEISPRPQSGPLSLSFHQERLWILDRLNPDATNYNVSRALRLVGELNLHALQHAVDRLVARHEVLRTTYEDTAGLPIQVIQPPRTVPIRQVDLSAVPVHEREAEAQRLLIERARYRFSLAGDLLLRVDLLQLSPREHVALFLTHHIAFDGWSKEIFFRELSELYDSYVDGRPASLPPLPLSYADFSHWQQQVFHKDLLKDQIEYWRKQLAGVQELLALPTDRPRSAVQSHRGARQALRVPRPLTNQLQELARQEQATLYMVLLAAFQTLLFRLCHQEDFLVATPIAGRNRKELEGIVGYFTNTLVLRADCSGAPTFRELLRRVRQCALSAYDHQDVPFEKLVNESKVARSLSYAPLCQVMLEFQNTPRADFQLKGLSVSPLALDRGDAKFDLLLSLTEWPDGLSGVLEYASDLFLAETVTRIRGHLLTLLESIAANPSEKIDSLPLLTPVQREALLHGWNQTKRDYPLHRCLHELFTAQAERTPAALAVVDAAGQALSYGQLNARANQLARFLLRHGVGPEVPVGVCLERSVRVAAALLGVLKAGGACLPLDPAYPRERLGHMLAEANTPVLLTQSGLRGVLPETASQIVLLDDAEIGAQIAREDQAAPQTAVGPDNLGYVIFTSGSTGRPKGVLLVHRGLVNTCCGVIEGYGYDQSDRILQFASLGFDAHIEEIFPSLLVGATVLFRDDEMVGSSAHFTRSLADHHITTVSLPTAFFHEWVRDLERNGASLPPSLRTVIVGGEQVNSAAYAAFTRVPKGQKTRWLNTAAPTECTVVSTIYEGDPERLAAEVPIGRPMGNVTCYLLDARLQPVPLGVLGEWVIGGAGVARGYLNRPQLTESPFIPDPFSNEPGERLYRTGDLGRRLPDGNIVLQGRLDQQVKLRGFRIEPGEIEAVLSEHPAVTSCVVIAREDSPGDKRLVAYLVPASPQAQLPAAVLREHLATKLPAYMVPADYVWLEALPLSPNGKLDRKALPMPRPAPRAPGSQAPQSPLEQTLCELFAAVLRLSAAQVGRDDDFFALGGHSLLVVQLVNRVCQAGGALSVSAQDIFRFPTICALAAELERRTPPTCLVPHSVSKAPGAVLLIPGAGGYFLHAAAFARALGAAAPVFSLIPPTHRRTGPMSPTLEALCTAYLQELLSTIPDGPISLIGHSFGGSVALELSAQLQECGREVGKIVLLDARPPTPATGRRIDRTAGLVQILTQLGLPSHSLRDKPFDDALAQAVILLRTESAANGPAPDYASWLWGVLTDMEASTDLLKRWTPRAPRPPTQVHLLKAAAADGGKQLGTEPAMVDGDFGWGAYLTLYSTQTIPGNHHSIIRPPHLSTTTQALAALLAGRPT